MKLRNLALVFALGCASPAAAQSLPYDNLFVFGDSLVDSGNAQIARAQSGGSDPAPAALGYFQGRFSNGYNFADELAFAITGAPATASLAGGLNYSFGGAQAREQLGDASPSFAEQLGMFTSSGRRIGANDLVLVTLGGNDIRSVVRDTGEVSFDETLTAFRSGLTTLVGAGARSLVITGLPDIGSLPATRGVALEELDPQIIQLASERSAFLNMEFSMLADNLSSSLGVNVQFFDLLGYQSQLVASPERFGLPADLNTTSFCQAGGPAAVLGGCTDYLFFDPVHPTAQVHQAIATAIEKQLSVAAVPEPATWLSMILGFGMLGGVLRIRRTAPRALAMG